MLPWTKGLYVNGSEDDLQNATKMLDEFLAHRLTTPDFANKNAKTLLVTNKTGVDMTSIWAQASYPKYETTIGPSMLHVMAGKPPCENRPLKVIVVINDDNETPSLSLMVTGNTYPFRTSETIGHYYKDNQVLERKESGATWFDQWENFEIEEAITKLMSIYKGSAMKIDLPEGTPIASSAFRASATKYANFCF